MTKVATKKKPQAVAAPPMPVVEFLYDIEQRSEAWMELRRGIPTASRFSSIMASGRDGEESLSREKYMQMLAGEIITGKVAETFRSEAMERGQEMEPAARAHYAKRRFDEVVQVGLVRRRLPSGRWVSCSPDSQVGKNRGLEIKTMRPEALIAQSERPGYPTKFKWQLYGTMLVSGWEAMDLLLFYEAEDPKDNMALEYTVERSEPLIGDLHNALEVFDHDLHVLVKRYRERMKG